MTMNEAATSTQPISEESDTAVARDELRPRCIATTGEAFNKSVVDASAGDNHAEHTYSGTAKAFRKALFTPDGTSIITQNDDQSLHTIVLPTDLLEQSGGPQTLTSYASFKSTSNIQNYAIFPSFDLKNPASTYVLAGCANMPITLRNALNYDPVQASFPLISPTTEAHLPPRSLAFTHDGSQFIVGSENLLAGFDCSRYGEPPMISRKLRSGRKSHKGLRHLQRRGFVSALGISSDGILALGTNEREIALYDNQGLGVWISTFDLDGQLGTGVTDLKWSPCGAYMFVAERQSNVVQVYDIRQTQQKVADLTGRYATTPQRLQIDVVATAKGYEVWGGGADGIVRMWEDPGKSECDQMPDAMLELHEGPVTSAIWHPTGAVMATASGGERWASKASDDSDLEDGWRTVRAPEDNTLKVWTV